MEMERFEPLKKINNNVYAKEAKALAMKYGLVQDDHTLTHLMAMGDICSQLAYKKKYNQEDLGKSSTADFSGYLPYVTQKDVKNKTKESNYTRDALKNNTKNNYQQYNDAVRARKMALKMKESEYKKTMWEAIDSMKGFMRMDAHLHPVVQRGIQIAEMQSDALYKEEWNLEKDAIYFPVQVG
jgi:hypothetical protein